MINEVRYMNGINEQPSIKPWRFKVIGSGSRMGSRGRGQRHRGMYLDSFRRTHCLVKMGFQQNALERSQGRCGKAVGYGHLHG